LYAHFWPLANVAVQAGVVPFAAPITVKSLFPVLTVMVALLMVSVPVPL